MISGPGKTPDEFAEVLAELDRARDRLSSPEAEAVEIEPERARRPRNRLGQVLAGLSWRRPSGGRVEAPAAAATAYVREATDRARSPREMPPAAPRAARTEPSKSENEAIAEELGLARNLGKAELERLRREFAKKNHPDRCAPAARPRAARRMSIANMLIDAELKQRNKPR